MQKSTRRRILPLALAIPVAGLAATGIVAHAPQQANAAVGNPSSRINAFALASSSVTYIKDTVVVSSASQAKAGLGSKSAADADRSFDK